jgi:uncharacterized protein (DUF924 family)
MTRTEVVLETFVYLPFNHLMMLLAREYFIEFGRRGIFKLRNVHFFYRSTVHLDIIKVFHSPTDALFINPRKL